ncbi:hypothetical protein TRVA0_057S00364 [Trichomonascus vanleenenianus]|uniref:uncharacterized protein n=1 Tax=Trichomonascus vanleenenianus TaxID=2268995 RepID=UPI003ECA0007
MGARQTEVLDTSTHTLTLYCGDEPYFVLCDKRRPELAKPEPIESRQKLSIKAGADGALSIRLGDEPIGEFKDDSDEEAAKLAHFVAQWRQVLSELDLSPSWSSVSSQSSAHSNRIHEFLREHKAEFTTEKLVSIRCVTWNVHGEQLNTQDLNDLLGVPIMADLYAVSLQESDILGPKNLYANTSTFENNTKAILERLGDSYELVASNQLLGLSVMVFANQELARQISHVRRATTGTGLFGIWGNKGAAAVWFRLGWDASLEDENGIDIAVVNCHLSAGDDQLDRRKWELTEIEKKLGIPGLAAKKFEELLSDVEVGNSSDEGDDQLVLLMGDLNFRISMDREMVVDFAEKGDFRTLVNQDQLTVCMKDDNVLSKFCEGEISFEPTYKLVASQPRYDFARVPSYTDRIFYSRGFDDILTQLEYASRDYLISDHKPVIARFDLTTTLIDYVKRKSLIDNALKDWDQLENSSRPIVEISPKEVTKKDGHILDNNEVWLEIHHASTSPVGLASWSIKLDPPGQIQAYPHEGKIPAGASQKIRLWYYATVESPKAEGIAIIQIANGADTFVPLSLSCLPSCIGASLDLMSRMPNGARKGQIMDQSSTNMPKEIYNCVDYIWTRLRRDMFETRGDPSLQSQVQEWLDNGENIDAEVLDEANRLSDGIGIFSVVSQFLIVLHYLDGGIIPEDYYKTVLLGKEGVNLILESIPSVNVNVLLYLSSFLGRAIDEARIPLSQILDIFEPILISIPPGKQKKDSKKRREFLTALLDK